MWLEAIYTTEAINKTELVCPVKLDIYGTILVTISGGSDSDIVMDVVERHKGTANVRYVFFDTGLEYDATKRQLSKLEQRYDVEIERMPAVVPIPISCKTRGIPFLSKYISDEIQRLQKHNFKWEDEPFEELLKKYPKCKQALKWWCNEWGIQKSGKPSSKNISKNAYLKEFIIENPPEIMISNYCCTGAKKRPLAKAIKKYGAVLNISGERRAEGGQRATANKSCFSPATKTHIARYRPLFFWTNSDKKIYEPVHEIIHSDCYVVYGLPRTGCFGCPFGSGFEDELIAIKAHEPKLYEAAIAIFGKSYEYTRKYRKFKEKMKAEKRASKKSAQESEKKAKKLNGQLDLFDAVTSCRPG